MLAAMRTHDIQPHAGSMVEAALPDVDIAALSALVKSRGYVLLRGACESLAAMQQFTDRFASAENMHFLRHQGADLGYRNLVDAHPTVATVTLGDLPVPWHQERGYVPLAPHLLFFWCERAAPQNGETLVTDGIKVREELPEPLRKATDELRVVHSFTVPESLMELVAELALESIPESRRPKDQSLWVETVKQSLPSDERLDVKIEGGAIHIRYERAFGSMTRWQHQKALCGYALHTAILKDEPITEPDGSPLSAELVEAAIAAADRASYAHVWKPGDLMLIDNTRIMHARNRLSEVTERKITLRMAAWA
jgi:alpha-ketoglutarate-dependent taurine dioxygenase